MAPIVKLKSSDEKEFAIDMELAKVSKTIRTTLLGLANNEPDRTCILLLASVHSSVLAKVIEWLNHHKDDPDVHKEEAMNTPEEACAYEMSEWDQAFFKMNQTELLGVIMAANYLGIHLLLKMGTILMAGIIKGLTPEAIRQKFKIAKDLTKAKEEQIRQENAWCEDSEDTD
jgi:S-phase kinase-associated protein 1